MALWLLWRPPPPHTVGVLGRRAHSVLSVRLCGDGDGGGDVAAGRAVSPFQCKCKCELFHWERRPPTTTIAEGDTTRSASESNTSRFVDVLLLLLFSFLSASLANLNK